MIGFKNFSSLQYVYGVIDVTQVHVQNPKGLFAKDYYSFKSKTYNIQLQVVVDPQKKTFAISLSNPKINEWCSNSLDFIFVPRGHEWGIVSFQLWFGWC
jgi:hypothetical protein